MTLETKPLSIGLLGSPEVSFEGRVIRFGRKKALALLCYLASKGVQRPRSELAELLWPRSEERRARTDLRGILSLLRKGFKEDGIVGGAPNAGGADVQVLAIDGELLSVEPRGVELDLRALEAAVSLARGETSETLSGHGCGDDPLGRRDLLTRLEGALKVYRGAFMEGFSLGDAPEFELWLEAERARWREIFGELCERVSRLQAVEGRLGEAVRTARLWAEHAPLEEAACRRLMELLSAGGDGEGALLAYEDFRSALRREIETEPSQQMMGLVQRLQREVEERTPLGASLARSATEASPSTLEVPFAGRREEFGSLVSEYHAVLKGETRVMTLVGEAGMGKTRLVKEFLAWARARGADVLKGGTAGVAGLPYGPLVEALRPRVEWERAPEDLLEDAWLSELSRLLPELRERYPDLPPAPSGEGETAKAGLFEAIARTVGALASRAPVVVFLDDMQRADAVTLEVLDYAGRRWAEQATPVLVLTTTRPEEPQGNSGSGRRLSHSGRGLPARNLILGPLQNEDVDGLLRRLAGIDLEPGARENLEGSDEARSELEHLGAWLAAESGGQPFYLVETLKTLLEDGKLVTRSRANGEYVVEIGPSFRAENDLRSLLPPSVREVIKAQLSRLSPAASDLLAAAAILGRGFGFEALLPVAGLEETEGLANLDELVERRLLREDVEGKVEPPLLQRGATYSFSHEKIRQVAYTECGQARRWVMHRRAFEVLEKSGAPHAELARHALAGGLPDPSFIYSVAAGDDAAEIFAVKDAIVHYERARDVLVMGRQPGGRFKPSNPNVERLYNHLGLAYELTNEWEKARATYETMLAFARGSSVAGVEVIALNHLAVYRFHHEGDIPGAETLLEEALEVAREARLTDASVETACNLASLMVYRPREFGPARLLAEETLATARNLKRPDLVARTLATLSRLETWACRWGAAAAHANEGAELSRRLAKLPEPPRTELPSMLAEGMDLSASWKAGTRAMEVLSLGYLAHVRLYQGRPQEAMAIAREVLGISEGLPARAQALGSWAIAQAFREAGEYEESLVRLRRGAGRAREARDAYLLAAYLLQVGHGYEALFELKEARAAFEEMVERGHLKEAFHATSCVLAALSGDWTEAHAHARGAHEIGTFLQPHFSLSLYHQVEALLRGGDEDLARVEVRRFAERARGSRRDRMSYVRALAVLDEWEGDTEGALGPLRKAEALAEEIGLPGELWQVRARIGELYEQRGDAGKAREAFSRAAQILGRLAEKVDNEELRDSFLSAPQVRRVLQRD